MKWTTSRYRVLVVWSASLFLLSTACGDDGGAGGGGALADEIAEQFTFTPDQPIEVLFQCARSDSVLAWFFELGADGSLAVAFTTDTSEDFVFPGTYSHANGQIRVQMAAGPTMPFPQGLDETSTVLMPQFGIVAAFATPNMACVAIGHSENAQPPEPQGTVNYDCPIINFQAATDEDNAIELIHRAVPFEVAVRGSTFRQRDIYVIGQDNPNVTRGYGIYRRVGDRFYASFQVAADFARFAGNQLPVTVSTQPPFGDFNLISGSFSNGDTEVFVDQLNPGAGPCTLR